MTSVRPDTQATDSVCIGWRTKARPAIHAAGELPSTRRAAHASQRRGEMVDHVHHMVSRRLRSEQPRLDGEGQRDQRAIVAAARALEAPVRRQQLRQRSLVSAVPWTR